jgi:TonB-linked SusC/RagA family outer membrane protein
MRKITVLFMCAVLAVSQLSAQVRKISGKVTNAAGAPIANASVIVKGTTTGTTTDDAGAFTLNVPVKGKTLVISSINYANAEVAISDNVSVTLQPGTTTSLSEVVVVAYGSVKKTNLTGSVATVKGSDLENKPFTSPDKALQGSVAGLQSSSVSGAPGASTDIRIRGIGSINASASPLWVIDGAIANTTDLTVNTTTANPLSSLNPDDIESISVLKDAAATAVYGSQAANGVILVTTKKGRSGKTRVNFSTEIGQNQLAFKNKNNRAMTTTENQEVLRESLINAGLATNNTDADALIIDPNNGYGLPANYLSTRTNWLDAVTRKGNQQQYNLSLSGGNEKTTFYASGGYFKQDGTTIATDFKRYNGSLSITHKASDRINFTAGLSGSTSIQNTPTNGGTFANPVLASFFLVPWTSPYNADGSLRYNDPEGQFPVNGGVFNPLVQAAFNRNTAKQTTVRGYVTGEVKILNDLKFTSRYSAEYFDVSEDQYRNPFYGDGQAQGGDAFSAYTRRFNYTFSNYFDYKKSINKEQDIYFDLKVGYEASAIKNYQLQAGGQAFPATLALQYLASAATPTSAFATIFDRTNTSIFSVGDINYKNRYVISGSFRRDGSSVFGANHLYGNFYSVGGTWNISEEKFLQNVNWLNVLKVRGSYGANGNSLGFPYFSALATYGYGSNYTGLPGSAPSNVGNDNLSWEKNDQFDVGLDFSVFKNRVYGSVDYYDRKAKDLLATIQLSPTSGFSLGQLSNVGSVQNKGIEVTIGGKPIVTKDFTWDVTFNIAHNINKVLELDNHSPIIPPATPWFKYTEGRNLQTYYLRQWAGVDPANGDPLWYTDATHKTTTNSISKAPVTLDPSRTAMPKYYGAFTNTFSYKGITLSAQLNYNFGNYVYDSWGSYLSSEGTYLSAFNQMSQELQAWKKPGDITRIPAIIAGGNKNSYRSSTRFLYKGDYIRLRDVQLAYSIPQKLIKKAYITSLSVYVRGTNLATFATDKYIPFDPEAGINSTTNLDVFNPRTISAGIKIGL